MVSPVWGRLQENIQRIGHLIFGVRSKTYKKEGGSLSIEGPTFFEQITIIEQAKGGQWKAACHEWSLPERWTLTDQTGRALHFPNVEQLLDVLKTYRSVADYECDRN